MRDELTDDLFSWIGNIGMERIESYVERGRRFSTMDIAILKQTWATNFQQWVNNIGDADACHEYQDLESELTLRNVEIPYDSVVNEIKMLTPRPLNGVKRGQACIIAKRGQACIIVLETESGMYYCIIDRVGSGVFGTVYLRVRVLGTVYGF